MLVRLERFYSIISSNGALHAEGRATDEFSRSLHPRSSRGDSLTNTLLAYVACGSIALGPFSLIIVISNRNKF